LKIRFWGPKTRTLIVTDFLVIKGDWNWSSRCRSPAIIGDLSPSLRKKKKKTSERHNILYWWKNTKKKNPCASMRFKAQAHPSFCYKSCMWSWPVYTWPLLFLVIYLFQLNILKNIGLYPLSYFLIILCSLVFYIVIDLLYFF